MQSKICIFEKFARIKLPPNKCLLSETTLYVQLTLVISKSKGSSETLRDIRTSGYQICSIEKNPNRKTKFHKGTCNLTP